MLRQIAFDTETTGIDWEKGHKVIEIGCMELIDRKLTGNHYHVYLNPDRVIDEGAFKVHGISNEFLQDKPRFGDIAQEFLQFIDGAELIIHNAPFDVGFINSELKNIKWPKYLHDHCDVFDTLVYARDKHPGQRNNLDALCKRYNIDNSNRKLHGALLDAELLALLYLAMTGGQINLFVDDGEVNNIDLQNVPPEYLSSKSPVNFANSEELSRHDAFIEFIKQKSKTDLWK